MAEDDASKTEEPTPQKLTKARTEGQVAMSQEIKSWVIILGSAMIVFLMAPAMMRDISASGAHFIEMPESIPFDREICARSSPPCSSKPRSCCRRSWGC